MIKSSIGYYAIYHGTKQIKVFYKAIYFDVFENAKLFADEQHSAGYPCTIEEFSFSSVIGVLVYSTEQSK